MESSALSITKLNHNFGDIKVLNNINLALKKGDYSILLGLNGAGKTTLFSLITRLYDNQTGSIDIFSKNIKNNPTQALANIGVVFQQPTVDLDLTVEQNLQYHASLHGMTKNLALNNAISELKRQNMENILKKKVRELSGGQRRRVEIVRALMHNPKLLLLDEPTKGMDPNSKVSVWNVLDKIQKHKTIIFTTQDFTEAERYADRIAILHDGNIKMDGTLDRLIEATHGLTRYSLIFTESPPDEFMNKLCEYPRVQRPQMKGLELEFYSRERKQFFNVLKLALNYNVSDLDTSICSLRDLYLGLTDGGLD